jgi:outer membrane protein assembly factor BamB
MLIAIVTLMAALTQAGSGTPAAVHRTNPADEALWDAARAGSVSKVTVALGAGADVNAKSRYGVTALMFAADKGHFDVVKHLLDKGADPNLLDTFYQTRALDLALMNNHLAVTRLLLERGSKGAPSALMAAVRRADRSLVEAALASEEITRQHLQPALPIARKLENPEILALIERKMAGLPAGATEITLTPSALQAFAGTYRDESTGYRLTFAAQGDQLTMAPDGQSPRLLAPVSATTFRYVEGPPVTFDFSGRDGLIERVVITQNSQTTTLVRLTPAATANTASGAGVPDSAARTPAYSDPTTKVRTSPRPWPAFRGANAVGTADGQGAVTTWDVSTGTNIKWKTTIPGMANASPIVWGNRVFVTTAISGAGDRTFKAGIYGDVTPVDDLSPHEWKIYCLDKDTGRIVWERTAHRGVPQVRRHQKASQANSTPVTDGTHVVALFGSIGMLAAWDVRGLPLWSRNVGVLDSGWFFDPTYQWGHSSSPILYEGRVIVQADMQKGSYIAAYDAKTGQPVWRTERDEISTWGTPTIFRAGGREQIVTNGTKIRGYDPSTGKLLWTLSPNSELTVGTPVVGDGLVYVTGGYPPVRPIYAIKPTAAGDISLPKERLIHEAIAWSNTSGTYIPTPLYYNGLLYTCSNEGILTAYDGTTGERIYRARVGGGGAFSASPIAADGRLYLANEDGDVIVAQAGRVYQELAKNSMKEVIMSTPAISDGVIVVRTLGHVYGIGQ